MNIVQTYSLNFHYKNKQVLREVNMQVRDGAIYGYLGKNGAGKTTTLKLLLGLLPNSNQTIHFRGKDIREQRIDMLNNVGNLIESPSLYEHFTAEEQFKYVDYYYKKGNKRIEELLSIAGLQKDRNVKIKHFSTGMKQRLSIGMAMFHDPDLLILDEPINGIDPEGVYEVRQLLLQLNSQNKTIILSSHILSEIEKLCSHVGIIDQGKLLYQGELDDLLSMSGKRVIIRTSSDIESKKILSSNGFKISNNGDNRVSFYVKDDKDFSLAIRLLVEGMIEIFNVDTLTESLENIYISLTNQNNE